jgi:hypothetical protein
VQSLPQFTPLGFDITVPVPLLVSVRALVLRVNVALTVVATLTGNVQAPVPLQSAPLQLVKLDPVAGVAVRVMLVP